MNLYRSFVLMGICAAVAVAAQTQPAPAAEAAKPARDPGLYATIQSTMGPIVVQLFEKETPITVKNFIDLQRGRKAWVDPKTGTKVTRPLFSGTTFHRVIPDFMIQGGDPAGNGTGDIGFKIKDEIVPTLKFDRPGRLAMANIGSPNTGSNQFFITVAPYPYLNGGYTLFGQVVDGQAVADQISKVPRNKDDKPLKAIYIKTITFERVGPAPANDPLGPARRPAGARKAAPAKPKPAAK